MDSGLFVFAEVRVNEDGRKRSSGGVSTEEEGEGEGEGEGFRLGLREGGGSGRGLYAAAEQEKRGGV